MRVCVCARAFFECDDNNTCYAPSCTVSLVKNTIKQRHVSAWFDHSGFSPSNFHGRSVDDRAHRPWPVINGERPATTAVPAPAPGTLREHRRRSSSSFGGRRHGCVQTTWCTRRDRTLPRCRRRRARDTPAAGGAAQRQQRRSAVGRVGGSSGHQMRSGVYVFYVHVQEEADGIS